MAKSKMPGFGLPPVPLSETARQLLIFVLVFLNLVIIHLGVEFSLRAGLQRFSVSGHHLILDWLKDNGIYGHTMQLLDMFVTAGACTAVSGVLGLLQSFKSKTKDPKRRNIAVKIGYVYILLVLGNVGFLIHLGLQMQAKGHDQADKFDAEYRTAFANAMWDYLYSPQVKQYIDWVQQTHKCCGVFGYRDWYLTDWLTPSEYRQRYYFNLMLRKNHADSKTANRSFYSLGKYGSPDVQRAIIPHLGDKKFTWEFTNNMYFNEAPFSCCNPKAKTFCRQQFANREMFAYSPAKDFSLFDEGCVLPVKKALMKARKASTSMLWSLVVVLAGTVFLYRILQSSQAAALAAGDPLLTSIGCVIPLTFGSGGGKKKSADAEPLLSETDSAGDTDTSATTGDPDSTGDDLGGPPPPTPDSEPDSAPDFAPDSAPGSAPATFDEPPPPPPM